MPVDPRRAGGGSAEIRGAQRIADLERRISQLERGSKGAIIASGAVTQTGTYNFPFPTATAIPWSGLTLTAQVPTVAILTFTGTVGINPDNLLPRLAYVYLYKGATQQAGVASFESTITTATTISIVSKASIAHAWRIDLAAGSTSLSLYGMATLGTLTEGSLTYIQTRA